MPYAHLLIKEGFYTEDTRSDSAGRWIDGDHVRFVSDFPQKIGGWTKLTTDTFAGVCRSIITWTSLQNWKYCGLGTNSKLYIFYDSEFFDITPVQTVGPLVSLSTGSLSNPFSTVQNSPTITVVSANDGLFVGSTVTFTGSTTVGGIDPNGTWVVSSIIDANTYTFDSTQIATSTVSNSGGTVTYSYQVVITPASYQSNIFSTISGSNVVTVNIANHGLTTSPQDYVYFANVIDMSGDPISGTFAVNSVIDIDHFTIMTADTPTQTLDNVGGALIVYYPILTLSNPFSTTMGSNVVTVTQNNNGLTVGTYITFTNASNVGGIDPNGTYTVNSIVDNNNYTFLASTQATNTVSGGGTVNYVYQIDAGSVSTNIGYGWGTGPYGGSTYGTPRQDAGFILDYPQIWTQATWGDDLIASPRNGSIYYWAHQDIDPVTLDIANIATIIANAPVQNKTIAVWSEAQYLIAFGCTTVPTSTAPFGVFNPMAVRWCAVNDYNTWLSPANGGPDTSDSGQVILSSGNEIVAVANMRGQILIATDTTLYSMYSDPEKVFAFKAVAEARIMGPNSLVEANGVVYIMGEEQFYIYDGTLRVIKCDVRQHVFEDNLTSVNFQQFYKVYGALNTAFNEIWWFYPSSNPANTNKENDSYVIYNFLKNIWYYGTLDRTSFIDIGEITPNPMGTSYNYSTGKSLLYAHEAGLSADGTPMFVFLESGDMTILDRNKFVYIKNLVPDTFETNTVMQLYLTTRDWPQSLPRQYGPYQINPTTQPIYGPNPVPGMPPVIVTPGIAGTDVIGTRAKGGQVSFRYVQNDPNYPSITSNEAQFEVGDIELQYLQVGVK